MKRVRQVRKLLSIVVFLCVLLMLFVTVLGDEGDYSLSSATGDQIVLKGKTLQLELQPKQENTEIPKVLWVSSDPIVASVNAKGLVAGKTIGEAEIYCKSLDGNTTYASMLIQVVDGVSKIMFTDPSVTLAIDAGDEYKQIAMNCTVQPETAYYQGVVWSSSDETVATVDENGIVTAVAKGKATIKAESVQPSSNIIAVCPVDVHQAVTGIELEEATTIYTGETQKLDFSIIPEESTSKKVIWTSSNPDVATVDANGNVKALTVGETEITCTADDEGLFTKVCKVTVLAKVKGINLEEKELTLLLGAGENALNKPIVCSVEPKDAYYQGLTYTSGDESIATVDAEGIVHGISEGQTEISILSEDPDFPKPVTCKVTVQQAVMSISLNSSEETAYTGTTIKLMTEVSPENAGNKRVIWSSSHPEIATVDANGQVKAISVGTAEIICTAADGSGVEKTCTVNVIAKVKGLAVSEANLTLLLGASADKAAYKLTPVITPENAFYQDVKWSSSNPAVATVDEDGTVHAIADGKAVITAVSTDPDYKANARCNVTVGSAVQSISFIATQTNMQKGTAQKISVKIGPEKPLNNKLTWSSNNENVLKVDANGSVKANGVGTAIITCTAQDGSGTKQTVTITVYQPVTSIKMNDRNKVVFAGQTGRLSVTVGPYDATNKQVRWSSDSGCVSVDSNGNLTGKYKGTATVTATAMDGSGKSCSIQVYVEPENPVEVVAMGTGIYAGNLLSITFQNNCAKTTITRIDFEVTLYAYNGSKISSGSYSTDRYTVGPNSKKAIKRTLSGVAYSSKFVYTVTGVELKDGTYYRIPASAQKTTYWG